MTIKYDKTPAGTYRALAIGTNYAYGMEYRGFGKTKAAAKADLERRLPHEAE